MATRREQIVDEKTPYHLIHQTPQNQLELDPEPSGPAAAQIPVTHSQARQAELSRMSELSSSVDVRSPIGGPTMLSEGQADITANRISSQPALAPLEPSFGPMAAADGGAIVPRLFNPKTTVSPMTPDQGFFGELGDAVGNRLLDMAGRRAIDNTATSINATKNFFGEATQFVGEAMGLLPKTSDSDVEAQRIQLGTAAKREREGQPPLESPASSKGGAAQGEAELLTQKSVQSQYEEWLEEPNLENPDMTNAEAFAKFTQFGFGAKRDYLTDVDTSVNPFESFSAGKGIDGTAARKAFVASRDDETQKQIGILQADHETTVKARKKFQADLRTAINPEAVADGEKKKIDRQPRTEAEMRASFRRSDRRAHEIALKQSGLVEKTFNGLTRTPAAGGKKARAKKVKNYLDIRDKTRGQLEDRENTIAANTRRNAVDEQVLNVQQEKLQIERDKVAVTKLGHELGLKAEVMNAMNRPPDSASQKMANEITTVLTGWAGIDPQRQGYVRKLREEAKTSPTAAHALNVFKVYAFAFSKNVEANTMSAAMMDERLDMLLSQIDPTYTPIASEKRPKRKLRGSRGI